MFKILRALLGKTVADSPGGGPGPPAQAPSQTPSSHALQGLLRKALAKADLSSHRNRDGLEVDGTGLVLFPAFHEAVPLGAGGVRTVTTIGFVHPTLCPSGAFEYQHATGDNVESALASGFSQWCSVDLVALVDAVLMEPKKCTSLSLELPGTAERPPRLRRVVLGPIAHFARDGAQMERQERAGAACASDGSADDHPFCPCCMFTKTGDAYRDLVQADGFFAIRMFAARGKDGGPEADCRVNGEDWAPGAARLREYVRTWPGQGIEFRKQYVVLHTRVAPQGEPMAEGPPGATPGRETSAQG